MSSSCTCAPHSTTASPATRSRKCCCNARSTAAFRRRTRRSTWPRKCSRRWTPRPRKRVQANEDRAGTKADPMIDDRLWRKGAMKFETWVGRLLAGGALLAFASVSLAQNVVKLGMVGEFSGPFAQYGQQVLGGMKAYMKVNGDTVAGKKIEIVQKDTTGPAPDVAKRLAQELVTRDNVDILVGFGLTPNALAVAPIATEAKKAMVIMNAATSIITTRSPYIVRVSMTLPQVTQPMAIWAARNGVKKVYTVVADYGPGLDAEKAFGEAFKKAGWQLGGSIHTPLQNPDFGPFVQRVKDAKPEAVFLFLPAGEQRAPFFEGSTGGGRGRAGGQLSATRGVNHAGGRGRVGAPRR